jgi:hypothetical protein
MNFAAFRNNAIPANGTVTEITSTDNGIVLTPDPIVSSGSFALAVDLKTVNNNIALGFNNWQTADPTGFDNLAVGNLNQPNTVGNYNIGVGNSIGPSIGSNNTILGQNTCSNLTGSNNFIEGKNILSGLLATGNNNIILSNDVFLQDSSSIETTLLIGNNSMNATLTSGEDIIIGTQNLQQMANSSNNLIIGHNNLQNASIAGNSNIYVGRRLNVNVTESTDNILIGRDIEFASNDKRNCIVIGQNIQLPAETANNTTIIGGDYIGLNTVVSPTYGLESRNSQCMHNFTNGSVYDFRYMKFLNTGPLNMVGVSNDVFSFDLNQLQFPNTPAFRMLTLEIVFNCTYFVEPAGFDPSDVYHNSSCTLGLIYSSQATSWKLMQLQSGYQEPSNNVDCNNNNNQVAFNMAVPYITTIGKYIPYKIDQDQLFLSGANYNILTYNIQMNTGFANSGVGGYSCMYKFYTSVGID